MILGSRNCEEVHIYLGRINNFPPSSHRALKTVHMFSSDQKPEPPEAPSSKVTQAELDALGTVTSRLVHGGVDR